jgi:hypothetical protein
MGLPAGLQGEGQVQRRRAEQLISTSLILPPAGRGSVFVPVSEYQDVFMLRPVGATIVARRSGPGYRLVVRSKSRTGMPVVDTLPIIFSGIEVAAAHARQAYGIAECQVEATGQPGLHHFEI